MKSLFIRDPQGYYAFNQPITESDIIAIATDIVANQFKAGQSLNNSKAVKRYLRLTFSQYEREVFAALLLDNHHRLLAYENYSLALSMPVACIHAK